MGFPTLVWHIQPKRPVHSESPSGTTVALGGKRRVLSNLSMDVGSRVAFLCGSKL